MRHYINQLTKKNFRCRDFQSAEGKKSAKIKCYLFRSKPQKLPVIKYEINSWIDIGINFDIFRMYIFNVVFSYFII
jgi:hypothetical protein